MDPLTLLSAVSQTAGGIGSAVGAYYGAKSTKSALKYQAAMSALNARLSEMSAQQALFKGQQDVAASTMRYGQVKGKQRASLAANGVDVGTGSAAEAQAATDIIKDIDKDALEANAIRSAWGYRLQGTDFQNQATMAEASASTINPTSAAFTSLLGSASGVAKSWYQFSKAGG